MEIYNRELQYGLQLEWQCLAKQVVFVPLHLWRFGMFSKLKTGHNRVPLPFIVIMEIIYTTDSQWFDVHDVTLLSGSGFKDKLLH